MQTWDYWMADVMTHARGAPDPLIRMYLVRSARRFFTRTFAWREWLEPSATRPGVSVEYDFDLPSQSQILRLERATLNGSPFSIQSFRDVPRDWTQPANAERSLVSRDLSAFTLTGDVPDGDALQVQVSLIPTLDATGLPDNLAALYMEGIAAGALVDILMIKEYADPQNAMMFSGVFDAAVGRTRADAYRGNTQQTPRVRPHWC